MPARRHPPGNAAASGSIPTTVGIVSDTHGLLRPEALTALDGCGCIIHAGDLGKLEIFERLSQIAPTFAVRGNVDRGPWADAFSETLTLTISGVNVYVLHDLNTLIFDPVDENICLVVSGHSHRPAIKEHAKVLCINPGSVGPRRFSLPVTLARLTIGAEGLQVELLDVLHGTVLQTLTTPRRRASA